MVKRVAASWYYYFMMNPFVSGIAVAAALWMWGSLFMWTTLIPSLWFILVGFLIGFVGCYAQNKQTLLYLPFKKSKMGLPRGEAALHRHIEKSQAERLRSYETQEQFGMWRDSDEEKRSSFYNIKPR